MSIVYFYEGYVLNFGEYDFIVKKEEAFYLPSILEELFLEDKKIFKPFIEKVTKKEKRH